MLFSVSSVPVAEIALMALAGQWLLGLLTRRSASRTSSTACSSPSRARSCKVCG